MKEYYLFTYQVFETTLYGEMKWRKKNKIADSV